MEEEDESVICLQLFVNSDSVRTAKLVRKTEYDFKLLLSRDNSLVMISYGDLSNRSQCRTLLFGDTVGEVYICILTDVPKKTTSKRLRVLESINEWQTQIRRFNGDAKCEYVFKYVDGIFSSIDHSEKFFADKLINWRCASVLFADKDPYKPKEQAANNNE